MAGDPPVEEEDIREVSCLLIGVCDARSYLLAGTSALFLYFSIRERQP